MKTERIKVLIADDHDLIRQGLKRIISFEKSINIIGEADRGDKIIEVINRLKPDVLLLDIKMPGMDGIEVLKKIREIGLNLKVIILTVENDSRLVRQAINIGADGYVLKDSAGMEIVDAVKAVYKGDKYIDKSLVSILFSNIAQKETDENSKLDVLTRREIEVLYYISKGLSNKEIGEKLFLSEKTVKNYATNIFRKLKVGDRVQATITAIEEKIEDLYN